jgi:hypothetical protein
MGDVTITADYRRTDQRTNVLENPFWITSGLVNCLTCVGGYALLFSFPTANRLILIHEVIGQNFDLAVGGSAVSIGSGTLATNVITTGGVITEVDRDEFIATGNYVVTANTAWGPTTGSDWLTSNAAGTFASPRYLLGEAATVPCVYAAVGASFTAGTFRVHMLVTYLPGT